MTNKAKGPQAQLLLIDREAKREGGLSTAEQGFIVSKKFENDQLINLENK